STALVPTTLKLCWSSCGRRGSWTIAMWIMAWMSPPRNRSSALRLRMSRLCTSRSFGAPGKARRSTPTTRSVLCSSRASPRPLLPLQVLQRFRGGLPRRGDHGVRLAVEDRHVRALRHVGGAAERAVLADGERRAGARHLAGDDDPQLVGDQVLARRRRRERDATLARVLLVDCEGRAAVDLVHDVRLRAGDTHLGGGRFQAVADAHAKGGTAEDVDG